jgi:hypothetical protein
MAKNKSSRHRRNKKLRVRGGGSAGSSFSSETSSFVDAKVQPSSTPVFSKIGLIASIWGRYLKNKYVGRVFSLIYVYP